MKTIYRFGLVLVCTGTIHLVFSSFKPFAGEPPHLRVSMNGRFLVNKNGKPFFWLGDTAWNLFINLNREEARKYLTDRKRKRFTVIQSHLLGWNLTDTNVYGARPFHANDFAKPNETYWKHVDHIISRAGQEGLYMALVPVWALNYIETKNRKAGDTTPMPLSDSLKAYAYGKFLGNRYKKSRHIIWVLGGDVWGTKDAIYDQLANGLTDAAANGDANKILISFHPQGGTNRPPATSTSEFYHNKPWLDFNMIQSGHRVGNKNFERIRKDYDTLPVKPTLESEPCYEQHPIQHNFLNGVFTSWHLRRRAYWAIFAGSLGFTYGANGIWQMDKPGKIDKQSHHNFFWYDALDFDGAKQMAFVRNLVESRTLLSPERIPDQTIIHSTDTVVDAHIQCARARDFSYLMAYSTNGSNININLADVPAAQLNAWWYNPRNGKLYDSANRETKKPFEVIKVKELRSFDPPGNASPESDWILVIDDAAKSFPPPGTVVKS